MGAYREYAELPAFKLHDETAVRIGEEPVRWGTIGGYPTAPPAIGERVHVRINSFGPGTVLAYFTEHGFLGVKVRPDVRPEWHVRQNPGREFCLVFGSEIEPEGGVT